MTKFEIVVLFSADLSTDNLKKLEIYFKDQIKKFNGSLIEEEDWGLRELSYQIKKNKKAFYKFYQIEIEGKDIQLIKENLNKEEQIIRYLFVNVENHSELPTKISESQNS